MNERWAPGVSHGIAPFSSIAEERAAEYRIDLFHVRHPYTSPLRLTRSSSAAPSQISASSPHRSHGCSRRSRQWPGKPPFTVLSTTNDMIALYSSGKFSDIEMTDQETGETYMERMPSNYKDVEAMELRTLTSITAGSSGRMRPRGIK